MRPGVRADPGVQATPDDGTRLSEQRLWDETARPARPAPPPVCAPASPRSRRFPFGAPPFCPPLPLPFPQPRKFNQASPECRAPCGSNPINASDNIVLPDPDSPTIPSVSPSPSVNETSFTGRTHPLGVGSSTVSPLTSRLVAMET